MGQDQNGDEIAEAHWCERDAFRQQTVGAAAAAHRRVGGHRRLRHARHLRGRFGHPLERHDDAPRFGVISEAFHGMGSPRIGKPLITR